MGHKASVDYIKSLGITSVELMPVHWFPHDQHLLDRGLKNFWGYNTLGFFALTPHYYGPRGIQGFREMVRAYHDAGIEVILDVVYNHTAEGNELGPTLSFKGIDNYAYYRTLPDQHRYYINDTGTGNTVNTSHPRVLQMVMDSLRYWADAMHIDGFRFDLGTILGREPEGFDPRGGFFDAMMQDPQLSKLKLIGEPWDIGPGGYQVGGFPPGWGEWNDKYRDTVREYWRGDNVSSDFAARLLGSGDLYDMRGRRPWSSINFITAHDGFTLNDLVSYSDKHNEANGENNNDGHNDNRSYHYGVEGPTDDDAINAVREQQKRNFLTSLLVSHGTPMLLAGDEFGRSQRGNNNGYCQDSDISWVHWENLPPTAEALRTYTRQLIQLRADQPLLRRESWRDGLEIHWFNAEGGPQLDEHWDASATLGVVIRRPDLKHEAGIWHDLLMLFNPLAEGVTFKLPMLDDGNWALELSTAGPDEPPQGDTEPSAWRVSARSMVLFSRA
jgi:glycogen operon protein